MLLDVQVQKLHVDVSVQDVTVDFCGNPQVMTCLVFCHALFVPACMIVNHVHCC